MKLNRMVKLASLACVGLSPVAEAFLGTSCIKAMSSARKVPGLLIEHLRQEACATGCQPKLDLWGHQIGHEIISELVDDSARYCDWPEIDYPEVKDDFLKFLDGLYDTTISKCKDRIEDKHLCDSDKSLQPFVDCVNKNSWLAVAGSLPKMLHRLAPYMSEEKCMKAAEYFTSDQLWERDFPEHVQLYVRQCHEL